MAEIAELLQSTTCACAVGMVVAEAIRWTFRRFLRSRTGSASPSGFLGNLSDFVNTALSAFILVVCTFEKALTLWGDFKITFFVFTFVLCTFYLFVFSTYAPTPCQPLEDNWHKIRATLANKRAEKKPPSRFEFVRLPIVIYLEHAISTLLGLCLGLFAGIQWLKFFWDGFMTSHHMTSLPILDQCLDCLNTNLMVGTGLEAAITFIYLYFFTFVEKFMSPRDGAKAGLFNSKLMRNLLKSAAVVLFTYLFMDVTGSFANPFLAYVLQRNCLNDVTSAFNFTIVYVIGPFLGTVAYMFLKETEKEPKRKV